MSLHLKIYLWFQKKKEKYTYGFRYDIWGKLE